MHIREVWEAWLTKQTKVKFLLQDRLGRLTEEGRLCQEAHADGYTKGYRKAQEEERTL